MFHLGCRIPVQGWKMFHLGCQIPVQGWFFFRFLVL